VKSTLIAFVLACFALASPAHAQGAPDTLGKIKASKAITVAFSTDSLPFSFVGDSNKPAGYSIDLGRAVFAVARYN